MTLLPATAICGVGGLGLWLLLSPRARDAGGREVIQERIARLAQTAGVPNAAHLAALVSGSTALAICVSAAMVAMTGVPVLGIASGLLAGLTPSALLRRSCRKRDTAIRDAWPVAVDELVALIRSGESLPGAAAALAERGPEALRIRFCDVTASYRQRGDFTRALQALVAGPRDPVGARVASALSLAHRVGGRELIRVLKALAELIREDQLIRKEIAARQSWSVSGARAAAAAPWVILALFSTRPSTLAAFQSPAGNLLVAFGVIATAAGYRAMIFMGRVKGGGALR